MWVDFNLYFDIYRSIIDLSNLKESKYQTSQNNMTDRDRYTPASGGGLGSILGQSIWLYAG
jgi:hypothetical protein